MSDIDPAMTASVNPTRAELNVLLAMRRAAGALVVVDTDSMILWQAGRPQYCNGKNQREMTPFLIDSNRA